MFVWSTLDAWRYGKLDFKSKSKSLIKHKRISIRFNWKTNHNVKKVEVLGMVSNNCVHYGYSYLWMVLWIRLSLILHLLLLSLAAYVINEKKPTTHVVVWTLHYFMHGTLGVVQAVSLRTIILVMWTILGAIQLVIWYALICTHGGYTWCIRRS